MLASDFLYQVFRKCGQMRPGYTNAPELLNDGLLEWQAMFDSFNSERTLNYTIPDAIYPVTGLGNGTNSTGNTFGGSGFQIGPTALDFVGPRPVAIVRANLYYTSSSPTPVRLPLSQLSAEEWATISAPILTPTNVTTSFYYDPQFPNGVLWFWPPLAGGNSIEIFTWGQLVPPAALTDPYAAPPGYHDLIVFRLAQRLYHLCTNDVMPHKVSHQYLCGQAEIAAAAVRRINAPMPRLRCDFRGGHGVNGTADLNLLLSGVPY